MIDLGTTGHRVLSPPVHWFDRQVPKRYLSYSIQICSAAALLTIFRNWLLIAARSRKLFSPMALQSALAAGTGNQRRASFVFAVSSWHRRYRTIATAFPAASMKEDAAAPPFSGWDEGSHCPLFFQVAVPSSRHQDADVLGSLLRRFSS